MSQRLTLVAPQPSFATTYREYISELTERGEPFIPFCLGFDAEPFSALLEKLSDLSRGIGVPEEYAPSNTYWLIDDNNSIVAVSNLRHYLTPALQRRGGNIGYGVRPSSRGRGYGTMVLHETIKIARARNMPRLLVTCAHDNHASIRVIEANGGKLEKEDFLKEYNERIRYYWIELAE